MTQHVMLEDRARSSTQTHYDN